MPNTDHFAKGMAAVYTAQLSEAIPEEFLQKAKKERPNASEWQVALYAVEMMANKCQSKKKNVAKDQTKAESVVIYTDGACQNNPGPGGWATIVIRGENETELSGGERQTTNNRMELMAVIRGLEELQERCEVTVYSDSQYVVNGIEKGWAESWRRSNWVKSDNKPALNPDLWERLLDLCKKHDVTLKWVKGHAGNKYNERCDQLAVKASKAAERMFSTINELINA